MAVVGQKARVTAESGLNLRTGAGTRYSVILTMPKGAEVSVLAHSNGWYKVTWSGKTGWCSGMYLTPIAGGGGGSSPGGSSAVDQAISRAQSGVGFSYHWGAGCWSPGGPKGACYGSCRGVPRATDACS